MKSDRFGRGAGATIHDAAELHRVYCEGQVYNRVDCDHVADPNFTINDQQSLYGHFEDVVTFKDDHLTIEGRGHPDGTITSGELVSHPFQRNFCVEARYRIPDIPKSWPAFWLFGDSKDHDGSEIDVEQPITAIQGVHDVSLYNYPTIGQVEIDDPHFTIDKMIYTDDALDASRYPHRYTICYVDAQAELTRYIDGKRIYRARWKWNETLGGTGHGPDPSVIVNLAVGGDWPGNVEEPKSYRADFDLYSIDYYGPS